ncbi:MAG: L-threonylcarbamoyladenylate synthase, partial [Candidatus Moranbacteria bacterium]|nr:L-threonylcarbamoyladenylate synthase [Candidatus Moranbacteria bacterium]
MKIIRLDLKNFSSKDIETISSELKRGKVLVLPTDTIYGLSALAENKEAVEKIYRIKKRDWNKPLVTVMKNFRMLRDYCYLSRRQYDFLKKELSKTRPVTVILKGRKNLPEYLSDKEGGVAVRIPAGSEFLMNILKKVGRPLVSTSLNVSGEKELTNLNRLEEYFKSTRPEL